MDRALLAAGLAVLGSCFAGAAALFSFLTRADWKSMAPPPPEPPVIAAQKLPPEPKAPKFDFYTPPKFQEPQPPAQVEQAAAEPVSEPQPEKAPDIETAARALFKAVKKPKAKAAFQRMNFSNSGGALNSGGGADEGPPAGAASQAGGSAPAAGAQEDESAGLPAQAPAQRSMRSVAPRGSVAPMPSLPPSSVAPVVWESPPEEAEE